MGPRGPLLGGALALLSTLAACATPAPTGDAKQLYATYCARCHGEDGRGERRSVGLNPRLNLAASEMVRRADHVATYQRIALGYGPMPGFAHKLDKEDIELLTQYTLTFAQP